MIFTSGLKIGKYELGKELGQGGFGFVFSARDTNLDREVALKFLHAEHTANPQLLQRFLQEARSAAKIVHPGIVTVFECGQVSGTHTSADGTAYIAMELLHGESLSDRLARSGRLEPLAAMEIARQVASALEAAHRAGIIHRDLKPDNIFLVIDPAMPSGERVKVLDFGIAKLAQQASSTGSVKTQSMMVFGTPRYMSPEQCKSAAHIDHRSDIYTLGCILFELLTGHPPFEGEPGELIAKHQLVPAPTASSLVPTIPDELDELVDSMLAKAPGERPQTMDAVQRALVGSGAVASGVAATLMPDDFDPGGSLRKFTPLPMPVARPDSSPPVRPTPSSLDDSAPRRRRSAPLAIVPHPTTLSGATGSSIIDEMRPSRLPYVAFAVLLGAGAATAGIFFLVHKSSNEPVTPPRPVGQQSPPAADAAVAAAVTPDAATPSATPPDDSLTPAIVEATVRARYLPAIVRCFDAYRTRHKLAVTEATIAVKIAPDGAVSDGDAWIGSEGLKSDPCASKEWLSWRFPAFRGTMPTASSPGTLVAARFSVALPAPAHKPADHTPATVKPPDTKPPVTKPPDPNPPDTKPCTPIKDNLVDPFEKNPCRR